MSYVVVHEVDRPIGTPSQPTYSSEYAAFPMSQDEDFSEIPTYFANDYEFSDFVSAMNGSDELESSSSSSGETNTFDKSLYDYELPNVYPPDNGDNHLAQDWQGAGANQFYAASQYDLETICQNKLEKVESAASTQTDWSSTIPSQDVYSISPIPKPETFTCQLAECVGKTFNRRIDLTRHTKTIHTGERYHCTISGCHNNLGKCHCHADKVQEHQQKHHANLGFRKKYRKRPNKGKYLVSRE